MRPPESPAPGPSAPSLITQIMKSPSGLEHFTDADVSADKVNASVAHVKNLQKENKLADVLEIQRATDIHLEVLKGINTKEAIRNKLLELRKATELETGIGGIPYQQLAGDLHRAGNNAKKFIAAQPAEAAQAAMGGLAVMFGVPGVINNFRRMLTGTDGNGKKRNRVAAFFKMIGWGLGVATGTVFIANVIRNSRDRHEVDAAKDRIAIEAKAKAEAGPAGPAVERALEELMKRPGTVLYGIGAVTGKFSLSEGPVKHVFEFKDITNEGGAKETIVAMNGKQYRLLTELTLPVVGKKIVKPGEALKRIELLENGGLKLGTTLDGVAPEMSKADFAALLKGAERGEEVTVKLRFPVDKKNDLLASVSGKPDNAANPKFYTLDQKIKLMEVPRAPTPGAAPAPASPAPLPPVV